MSAPSREEIGADRAFISRRELAEDARARRRAHAFGAEEILDPERRAFERARFARGALGVGRFRPLARQLRRRHHERVEMRVGFLDRVDERVGEFDGGELLLLHAVERVGESEGGQIGHELTPSLLRIECRPRARRIIQHRIARLERAALIHAPRRVEIRAGLQHEPREAFLVAPALRCAPGSRSPSASPRASGFTNMRFTSPTPSA